MFSLSRARAAISSTSILSIFVRNNFLQVGEQMVNVTLGLMVAVYFARELGPGMFGVWSLCIALLRMAMTALAYGMDVIILRHCSSDMKPDEGFLASVIILRAINAFVILVAGLLALYLLPEINATTVSLILVMMVALVVLPFEGLEFWFRATSDAIAPAIARCVSVVIGTALKITLLASGAAIVYAGAAHALQIALFGTILLGFYISRGHRFTFDASTFSRVRSLYREAWPLFVTTLGYLVYARIDIIMLSSLKGDEAAGIYAAAVRISEVANLGPVIFMTAAAPFFFNGMRNHLKSFSRLFHVFLTGFNVFFLLVSGFVCLLAPLAVQILFGASYADSASILSIHIFGLVFLAQGVATQYWWIARRRPSILMWRALAGGGVNILLNAILIPKFGGVGAAAATVISQFFASVAINLFLGRNGWYLLRMQLIPKLCFDDRLKIDELIGGRTTA